MSELDSKITAVEFALRSFARADNEDVRKKNLQENFETIPCLNIYFGFRKEQLKTKLGQLRQLKINENAKQRRVPSPQIDETMSFDSVLKSSSRISFKNTNPKCREIQTQFGNAVAISPTLALTALHGIANIGHDITLHTHDGIQLHGKVIFNVFEQDLVDIAVIELVNDGIFSHFTPILGQRPVHLFESVYIVGYKFDTRDRLEAAFDGIVNAIERKERSVVVVKESNQFRVVGVHVAAHDNTTSTPPMKKAKHTDVPNYESVPLTSPTNCKERNIHRHSDYTIICEIARVPELIEFLRQRELIT